MVCGNGVSDCWRGGGKCCGISRSFIFFKFANPIVSTIPPDHGGARYGCQMVALPPNWLYCVALRCVGAVAGVLRFTGVTVVGHVEGEAIGPTIAPDGFPCVMYVVMADMSVTTEAETFDEGGGGGIGGRGRRTFVGCKSSLCVGEDCGLGCGDEHGSDEAGDGVCGAILSNIGYGVAAAEVFFGSLEVILENTRFLFSCCLPPLTVSQFKMPTLLHNNVCPASDKPATWKSISGLDIQSVGSESKIAPIKLRNQARQGRNSMGRIVTQGHLQRWLQTVETLHEYIMAANCIDGCGNIVSFYRNQNRVAKNLDLIRGMKHILKMINLGFSPLPIERGETQCK
jgi:hypothetical protein